MIRTRLLLVLWIGALIPTAIPLSNLLVQLQKHEAIPNFALSLCVAILIPLLPSLPGLLGTSMSRRRSLTPFLIWVTATILVELITLALIRNTYFNRPRLHAFGIEPSMELAAIVYVCACVLDSLCFVASTTKASARRPA